MEENQAKENPIESKSGGPGTNPLIILGVVVVAVVIGFGLLAKKPAPASAPAAAESTPAAEVASDAGPTTTITAQSIMVEGGEFYYKPNEIRVKVGQPVKIIFNNVKGFHDIVIDEFNVKTPQIQGPNTAEITFTPDKAGSYKYYCSVGRHRQMGMEGTLVVE